jgi:hypothetical protein
MNKKPSIKMELNIFGRDGFRMSIPISEHDYNTFRSQSKKGSYFGELTLWATASIDFKYQEERNEFYKHKTTN